MPQVPSNPAAILRREENKGMFGFVDVLPEDFAFENEYQGEKVFVKTRAHPITNLSWILNSAFLTVLPFIITVVIMVLPFNINLRDYFSNYVIALLILIYYSLIFTTAFYNFLDWYYDLYIVTNIRIINIQFKPLYNHHIAEARLNQIQDVSESSVGIIPQMFDYGDVMVQTAAKTDDFIFKSVPNAGWFRDVISDLSSYYKSGGE